MSKIDTGYGYRLLKAGERIIETDEAFSAIEGWYRTSAAGNECSGNAYYRRRIDPGEGYRLLSVGETILLGDEFFDEGKWIAPCGYGHKVTVTSCTFRRKVQVEGGWIKLSDRLPEANTPVWLYPDYRKSVIISERGFSDPKGIDKNWTHWKPAIIPQPPVPEKSEAEKAWDKFHSRDWLPGNVKDIFIAGYDAWKGAQ